MKRTEYKYTLEQLMKLQVLINIYKDESKLYSEISKILIKDIKIPKKETDLIIKHFIDILNEKPEFKQRFIHDGIEYGFIPNLDMISTGEYIDLDEYGKQGMDQAHKIMSILYRPITNKIGDLYQIEEYQGTNKYCDIMLQTPYDIYLSALVFFWNLSKSLLNHTITYTHKQARKMI